MFCFQSDFSQETSTRMSTVGWCETSFLSQNSLPCNKNPAAKKIDPPNMMFCTIQSSWHPPNISLSENGQLLFSTKTTWIWPAKAKKKTFEGSLGLWQSMSPSYLKHHLQRWTLTPAQPKFRIYIYEYIYIYLVLIYLYTCVCRERERGKKKERLYTWRILFLIGSPAVIIWGGFP